ncbi:hypothetical protein [Pantoea sp.]|uniref:hypothetical protein n=1 Tax=Pantoea sp. TaxID=69393 RepID=UPI00290CD2BD|nr:hypothetical protein [Pantoea sp.]MDU5476193.1 hypothetical protein [Pantoea sp.]
MSKEVWNKCNAMLTATDSYKAAQQQWGTGSVIQKGIQAATAAVQGLALQPDAGNNRRVCTVSGGLRGGQQRAGGRLGRGDGRVYRAADVAGD